MARKKNLGKSLIKLAHDINKSTIDTLARRLNEADYQLSKNLNLESLKKLLETVNDTEKQLAKMRKQSLRQAESNKVYSQLKKAAKLKEKINTEIDKIEKNNPFRGLNENEIKSIKLIRNLLCNYADSYEIRFEKTPDYLKISYLYTNWICNIYFNQTPYKIIVFNKEYDSISFDFDEVEDLNDIKDIFIEIIQYYKNK